MNKNKMIQLLLLTIMAVFLFTSCGLVPIDVNGKREGVIREVTEQCPSNLVGENIPQKLKDDVYQSIEKSVNSMLVKLKKEIADKDTHGAKVTISKILMTQLNVPATKTDSNTLGIIKDLKVNIMYEDGSKKVLLAEVVNNPSKSTSIDFKIIDTDLVDYLTKGSKIEVVNLAVRSCPDTEIKFEVEYTATITF